VSGIRQRIEDERRNRTLSSRVLVDVTPPASQYYGAFGARSVIVPPARVMRPDCVFVGDDVRVHEHAWIAVVEAIEGVTPRLSIGNGTSIGRFCHLACVGEIEIGPEVLAAERVFIADTYHGYEDVTRPVITQPMAAPEKVTIGWGSFLGEGAIVLAGVTIGEQAYVGAGAVVTHDVPPRTIVAGNPARVVRRWDDASGEWIKADS
jgi:acetyltransferase-like isoleucine patch superfamily enzyme